ncbi:protein phosphatase inhibitor 2 family member C [Ctenodactylus gundi]
MATQNTSQKPIKGILKNKEVTSTSVSRSSRRSEGSRRKKNQRWDESNIRATQRSHKDSDSAQANQPSTSSTSYARNQPSTSYARNQPTTSYAGTQGPKKDQGNKKDNKDYIQEEAVTADALAKKLAAIHLFNPHKPQLAEGEEETEDSGSDSSSELSLSQLRKELLFEMRRKIHSNEGRNIRFARQLLCRDLEKEDSNGKILVPKIKRKTKYLKRL